MEEHPRKVAEWYDALSQSYDELYGEEQSNKQKRVSQFLNGRVFRLIVDVGCGTGTFLQSARGNYEEAVGIDFSSNMLKRARARTFPGSVELIRAESSSLPIKDAAADCVVSISLIDSKVNFSRHLTELRRIGKQPGTIVMTIFKEDKAGPSFDSSEIESCAEISQRETLYCVRQRPRHAADPADF